MKNKAPHIHISPLNNEVIEMAWCDNTSFETIYAQTGLQEKEVIKVMRTSLKPSSFKIWRKRVSGRRAKHDKLND